jgi:hypothetical protein
MCVCVFFARNRLQQTHLLSFMHDIVYSLRSFCLCVESTIQQIDDVFMIALAKMIDTLSDLATTMTMKTPLSVDAKEFVPGQTVVTESNATISRAVTLCKRALIHATAFGALVVS